jgi:hypothetical protein
VFVLLLPRVAVLLQAKAFCSHAPHRFGTLMFVLKDVLRSKGPLRDAVMDAAWGDASAGSSKAQEVHRIVAGYRTAFWEDAALLETICQPIMDAIHNLEGDKPLLSQLRSVYKQIREHFQALMTKEDIPDKVKRSRLLTVAQERLDKHYKPCFDAAFLVDPINFIKQEGEWFPPVAQLSNEERKNAFEVGTASRVSTWVNSLYHVAGRCLPVLVYVAALSQCQPIMALANGAVRACLHACMQSFITTTI